MGKRLLSTFVLLCFLCLPTTGWAVWTDVWTKQPAGGGSTVTSISTHGQAFLVITSGAAALDPSPFIKVVATRGTTLCMDTDVDVLAASGATTADIYWSVGVLGQETDSVIVAQLSSGTPCVFDIPPGEIHVELTTTADQPGQITIRGNGD